MPFGGQATGFVYFAAMKYLGYSAFCRVAVQPKYVEKRDKSASLKICAIPSFWKAGAIRTLIGITIGAVVGLGFWKIPYFSEMEDSSSIYFFAMLIPVRIVEWQLLLRWVYRDFKFDTRALRIPLLGTLTSFALDGLGILAAFVLPGGIWIC